MFSKPLTNYAGAICAACMLLACSGAVRQAQSPAEAGAAADAAYAIARSQHMAMRFGDAAASYRSALQAAPGHANAVNGLAALHAEQGDYAAAIALWQPLTGPGAQQAGAANAYLFANLGYAYFLQGDYPAALATLEKACMLDPLDARAWQRLGSVLDKLGQHRRAAQMKRQAATLRSHDFAADYAMADRSGIAAIDFAVYSADPADHQQWDRTEVREAESGVFVLRRIPAVRPAGKLAATAFALPGAPLESRITIGADGSATLEIRNGNGVAGAARAMANSVEAMVSGAAPGNTARKVDEAMLRVVLLTNHKGYGVRHTRVEYRPSHRGAAERLAERVGTSRVVAAGQGARADLRLVIGSDLRPALASVPSSAPAPSRAMAAGKKEAAKAG